MNQKKERKPKKYNGYWQNINNLKEEALKHETKGEFQKNNVSAYNNARKLGVLNDICKHMIQKQKSSGYWTYETCKQDALKFEFISDFRNNSPTAYSLIKKKGWLEELTSHLKRKRNNYWSKEICHEISKQYSTKTDFLKGNYAAYQFASRHKFIDEICSHMKTINNIKKRMIYAYEFEDKTVYVGLTWNIIERNNNHINGIDKNKKKSPVYNYILQHKIYPKLIHISDYINVDKAKELEKLTLEKYKKNGWNILNKAKAGGIGGGITLWTKEKCAIEAKKYISKSKFCKCSNGAYSAAKSNGWLEEITEHMIILRKKYSYEECEIEAKKYDFRIDFQKKSSAIYQYAKNKGWYEEICMHMKYQSIPKEFFTLEICKEEAKKYTSRHDFKKYSSQIYTACVRRKWLNEVCKHMIKNINIKWTYENCKKESLKYKTKQEFKKNNCSAYNSALKNKWLDDICKHMIEIKKPKGYWNNKINCKMIVKNCKTRKEFDKKYHAAYENSRKNCWLDEFFPKKKAS